MAREISKGICTFCHREISKSGMSRHLEACEQRGAVQAKQASHQLAQKTKVFHLVVGERYWPTYWMHLEVAANITLATLDQFLRDIWLECCGHLSAFTIGGVRYVVDEGLLYDWDNRQKNMHVRLDEVFSPGQTSSYEYDFGSTTELTLKVVSVREVEARGKSIQVLARNIPPFIACNVCGKPATSLCAQCVYDDEGYLCDACATDHKCGQEMLSPLVNSPRAGVCGYTGPDPAFTW